MYVWSDIQHFNNILSNYQSGFHRGHSTQHCPLAMIKKWKKVLHKGGFGEALSVDLSRTFDSLKHALLIAKLAAYTFASQSLKFILSYLSWISHRIKTNNAYSKCLLRHIWWPPRINTRSGIYCSTFIYEACF